jgi:hypothetical protein
MFFVLNPWPTAPVAYSSIRPKSQIFNIGHDYALWIRNFMVMMKKLDNFFKFPQIFAIKELVEHHSKAFIIENASRLTNSTADKKPKLFPALARLLFFSS